MGFPQARIPHQDDRFSLVKIMALSQGQDFLLVELGQSGEVEVSQLFAYGEMSFFDATYESVLSAAVYFLLDEGGEIAFIRPAAFSRCLRPFAIVVENGGQMKVF